MLDEELDDIIRKAAENHHPAYNDKAWEMMELKLDKHLPQKKDRKRLIFFLLFFPLLGAAIFLSVNNFSKEKKIAAENNDSKIAAVQPASTGVSGEKATAEEQIAKPKKEDANPADNVDGAAGLDNAAISINKNQLPARSKISAEDIYYKTGFTSSGKAKTKTRITTPGLFNATDEQADLNAQKNVVTGKTSGKQRVSIKESAAEENNDKAEGTDQLSSEKANTGVSDKTSVVKTNTTIIKDSANSEKINKDVAKKTEDKSIASRDKKKKKNNTFGSNFGFTFSAGPDISFVKLSNTGKTTLAYGAGLSYNLFKRFTAKAGFYVSKKIYNATPDQYHSPGGNYPNLTGVNADCKVYEIPISLAYSFGQRGKHNWFGNAGLSSFIMKKEDYVYNYKNSAGQTYSYYQEISNKNKHYFAVLDLSAGYQYQVSKRLSVQAEPYLKLPLSGVGHGKIKLSSTGVLFTVTLKPFANKK